VETALRALAGGKAPLPAGIGMFLRAAQVVEVGADRIVLELPPGPGLDRLSEEAVTLHAVEEALAAELGTRRTIVVQGLRRSGDRGEGPGRLTPEKVKAERLARMSRDDPMLGQAVEEWDLELLE
jgi:hypothetical protein